MTETDVSRRANLFTLTLLPKAAHDMTDISDPARTEIRTDSDPLILANPEINKQFPNSLVS